MRTSHILVLSLLCFLCILPAESSRRTPREMSNHVEGIIKDSLPHLKEGRNLRNVYYSFKTIVEMKQDLAKVSDKLKLCAHLNKLSLSDLPERENQVYLLDLSRLAKCNHTEDKSAAKVAEEASKSNLVNEYILGALFSLSLGKKNDAICNRAVDFFGADGTSVFDLNDKTQKTLYWTPFLLEIVVKCDSKPGIFQSAVKNLLLNTYPIYKNGLTLVEGDSVYTATAHLLYAIYLSTSLKTLKEFQEKEQALGFFIQHQAQYIEDGEELFAYFRVGHKIKNNFFQLENTVFDLSKKGSWELVGTLYSAHMIPLRPEVWNVTATFPKGEKVKFERRGAKDTAVYGKLSGITEPGYYDFKAEVVGPEGKTYTSDHTILVRKKIQVDTVRFDVATSNKRPTDLANEVKGGKTFGEVLKSNQNGFIFVSFKVSGIENPAEVALRLIHPQYLDATGTVAAKFNKDTYHYEAVLDLGNPDVILPYNAQYKLNLTVADLYGENVIQWTLASFDLTFTKNQQGQPPSDADYKLLPEIKHVFPAERVKPNPIITIAFDVLAIGALLMFFYGLGGLKVNFGRYPSSGLGPIFALLFVVDILALLGILTWFWIEISIFKALGLLAIAIIPTVVIGNLTFTHLETADEDATEEPTKGTVAAEEEQKKDDGDKKAAKPKKGGKKAKDE